MKVQSDYWKRFWDEQARHAESDFALNRRTSIRLEKLEEKSLSQFFEAVNPQPGDTVLDAGCGSGRNISLLSPFVKEVIGIDYSDQMIVRAREKIEAEKLANIKLETADITQLRFPDDSFDKVICASVLQYLDTEDCTRALKEMIRVCRPGGRLVLHIKNGRSLYGLSLKVLRPVAKLLGKKMKPEFYRSRAWHQKILHEAGCSVIGSDGFGLMTFVPLPQSIVGWLLKWETNVPLPAFLKKFAVNYKMTVSVGKQGKRK